MRNRIGPPVIGNDFFGRQVEMIEAWSLLKDGNHLLLTAPRRVGKTSFVRRLEHDTEERGWQGIYVDVEDKETEVGFVLALLDKLKTKESFFKKIKGQAFEKIGEILKSLEVELKAEEIGSVTFKWSQSPTASKIKEKIVELLTAIGSGLIIIDELPVLLNRVMKKEDGDQRVADFLHWLRSLRQLQDAEIRWIFCGSIGLDSFTERFNLTKTVNDLYSFNIGAFSEEVADKFLIILGQDNGFSLTSDLREALIHKVGWPLPYYLQLLFNKVLIIKRRRGQIGVSVQDLDEAFNLAAVHSNLGTWMERLDEQLSIKDAQLAKAILDELSQKPNGLKRSAIERIIFNKHVPIESIKDKSTQLLKMLMRDGYLLTEIGKYAFRSPLLRIYWYNSRIL